MKANVTKNPHGERKEWEPTWNGWNTGQLRISRRALDHTAESGNSVVAPGKARHPTPSKPPLWDGLLQDRTWANPCWSTGSVGFHKPLHHRHLTPVEMVPLRHTWCPALMISCQWVLFLCHANQDHECLKESSWSPGPLGLCCVPHSPWNTANFEAFCKPAATAHLKTERNPLPSTLGGH